MTISVTNIGVAKGATSTTPVTVPSGGVPAGALIFVLASVSASANGSGADTAGNRYITLSDVIISAGHRVSTFYAEGTTALVAGNTVTYASDVADDCAVSACYATGIATSGALDTAAVAIATGSSAAPSVTSGTPATSGELFIGCVAQASGNTTSGFTQASGWSTPPAEEGTSGYPWVDGGYKVNSGASALTYAPTITSAAWACLIYGFIAASAAKNVSLAGASGSTTAGKFTASPLKVAGAAATTAVATALSTQGGSGHNLGGAQTQSGVGSLRLSLGRNASGATSTSTAAALVKSNTRTPTGVVASSSIGALKQQITHTLSGVAATSAAKALTRAQQLLAAVAASAAATLRFTLSPTFIGVRGVAIAARPIQFEAVAATSVAARLGLSFNPIFSAATATAAAPSLVPQLPGALLAGAATQSAATTLLPSEGNPLAGVAAAAGVGVALSTHVSLPPLSVTATGAVGSMVHWISSHVRLSGVGATGSVGAFITGHLVGVHVATTAAQFKGYTFTYALLGAHGQTSVGFAVHDFALGVSAVAVTSGASTFVALIYAGSSSPVVTMLTAALAGNAPVLGCYEANGIFDLGYTGNLALAISWTPTGTPLNSNFLAISDVLNIADFLAAASGAGIVSWAEVNIGQDNGFGGASWGGWQKYVPGIYPGRYAKRRWWVQSSAQVQGVLADASSQCSVEDRVDHYQNFSCPTSGTPITFTPDNTAVPKPFNSGLNGSALPTLAAPVWAQTAGDIYQYSDLSLSGVTLTFFNAGVAVQRAVQTVTVSGF